MDETLSKEIGLKKDEKFKESRKHKRKHNDKAS